MPAKPLTAEQHDDARRLKLALEKAREQHGITQADLAALCGWDSQSTVSQYATGRIPLNVESLALLCIHLRVPMHEISPTLAKRCAMLARAVHKDQRAKPVTAEWPFVTISPAEWVRLSAADRHAIERFARWQIDQRTT